MLSNYPKFNAYITHNIMLINIKGINGGLGNTVMALNGGDAVWVHVLKNSQIAYAATAQIGIVFSVMKTTVYHAHLYMSVLANGKTRLKVYIQHICFSPYQV